MVSPLLGRHTGPPTRSRSQRIVAAQTVELEDGTLAAGAFVGPALSAGDEQNAGSDQTSPPTVV
jgi:hypothetical protein